MIMWKNKKRSVAVKLFANIGKLTNGWMITMALLPSIAFDTWGVDGMKRPFVFTFSWLVFSIEIWTGEVRELT